MDPRHRPDQQWSDHSPSGHYPHQQQPPPDQQGQMPPTGWAPHPSGHMIPVQYGTAGSPPPHPQMYMAPMTMPYNMAQYPHPDMYKSVPARQRSTIACLSCRKRKIRCEQREDGRCENCFRINQTCEFVPVSSQKVTHTMPTNVYYKPGPNGPGPGQSPVGPAAEAYSPLGHHPTYLPQPQAVHYASSMPQQAPGQYPHHHRHPSQYGPTGSPMTDVHGYPMGQPPSAQPAMMYSHVPHHPHPQQHPHPHQHMAHPAHGQMHPHAMSAPESSHGRVLQETSPNTLASRPVLDMNGNGKPTLSGSRSGRDVLSIRNLVAPENSYDGPAR